MIKHSLQDVKDEITAVLIENIFRGKNLNEITASDFFVEIETYNLKTYEVLKTNRAYAFKSENIKILIKDIFPNCWKRSQQEAAHFGITPKQYLKEVYFDGFKRMFEKLENYIYPNQFDFVPEFDYDIPF